MICILLLALNNNLFDYEMRLEIIITWRTYKVNQFIWTPILHKNLKDFIQRLLIGTQWMQYQVH